MIQEPGAWLPRAAWDALVRGEGCPLCAEIAGGCASDEYGHTVADLRFSRLRLGANQFVTGYCVLICTRHVREPYDLTPAERALFFDDLLRAGQALDRAFNPVKMNFQLLGNAVPHLHAHLIPRYYGDPAPGTPLDPNLDTRLLTPEGYATRVAAIRAAVAAIPATG